ncbi:MAG: HD domain-containing protein [Patescibacteria group bacterium]|nr:HD domain-containing protein [Patescibacteria group bacterium]MDD4304383.1 HD domain-containing protein [Patescibacteria group bacterium]MDD4695406.1 HD domain-containing protein [Patescibacteria group bacterium]
MLTLEKIKNNKFIKEFVLKSEKYLDALKYTDHGKRHINIVADRARSLAKSIGLSNKYQEMCAIAGYCHDMGNFMGRTNHHHFGATLFMNTFLNENIDPEEITTIMQAIASHDKNKLKIVNSVSAVLILADKSDVHRTRVKRKKISDIKKDIHDRVNYAVLKNNFYVNKEKKEIKLKIEIDIKITNPMDYFEIFIERMILCRSAAKFLGYKFVLVINNFKLS